MGVTKTYQPGVETRAFYSKTLDQELQLYIKLPWNYERSDQIYPVLYVLDANRSFSLYSTMSLIFETPGSGAEQIIIVGIGYKVDEDRIKGLAEWAAWRTRDLLPEVEEEVGEFWTRRLSSIMGNDFPAVKTGGASKFLDTIHYEIIPFIQTTYRADTNEKGLAGYSYGGLFVLYVLFSAPGLFTRFFAGSPSIREKVFDYEAEFAANNDDLQAKIFMTTASSEEELIEKMGRLTERLRSRGFPGLDLQTHVFEGESHRSAAAAAVSRALRVLFRYE